MDRHEKEKSKTYTKKKITAEQVLQYIFWALLSLLGLVVVGGLFSLFSLFLGD